MTDINRVAGKRIRNIREGKGLSQEAFAALCGLHRTYIGAVERGERNITLKSLQKIAKALEVPVVRLLDSK